MVISLLEIQRNTQWRVTKRVLSLDKARLRSAFEIAVKPFVNSCANIRKSRHWTPTMDLEYTQFLIKNWSIRVLWIRVGHFHCASRLLPRGSDGEQSPGARPRLAKQTHLWASLPVRFLTDNGGTYQATWAVPKGMRNSDKKTLPNI